MPSRKKPDAEAAAPDTSSVLTVTIENTDVDLGEIVSRLAASLDAWVGPSTVSVTTDNTAKREEAVPEGADEE